MGFRKQFLNTPAGPQREALVFNEAIKRNQPVTIPITVPGPGNTKITYKVMPDFLTIDGIRVPMSAVTAQKLANHFGMTLPTSKMVDQIWQSAKNTNSNLVARPLSGTGVNFEGKQYSAQDIIADVSRPEFAIAYNERIDSDPTFQQNKNKNVIFSGHMKEIVQPESAFENKLHFRGLMDAQGNPIQTGRSPHSAKDYSEYTAGARFIDSNIKVTTEDGQELITTLNRLMNLPNLAKAISDTTKLQQYRGSKTNKPGPPLGYTSAKFPTKQIKEQAQTFAMTLLRSNKPLWSLVPISLGGKNYIAKIEPHGTKVPRGISIYERKTRLVPVAKAPDKLSETIEAPKEKVETSKPSVEKRQTIWDRVNNFLNRIGII